jgi:hypothetical protein
MQKNILPAWRDLYICVWLYAVIKAKGRRAVFCPAALATGFSMRG